MTSTATHSGATANAATQRERQLLQGPWGAYELRPVRQP